MGKGTEIEYRDVEGWRVVETPAADGDAVSYIDQLLADGKHSIVMVSEERKFYCSDDGGVTWIPLYPVDKKKRLNLMTVIFLGQCLIFIWIVIATLAGRL